MSNWVVCQLVLQWIEKNWQRHVVTGILIPKKLIPNRKFHMFSHYVVSLKCYEDKYLTQEKMYEAFWRCVPNHPDTVWLLTFDKSRRLAKEHCYRWYQAFQDEKKDHAVMCMLNDLQDKSDKGWTCLLDQMKIIYFVLLRRQ